MLGRARAIATAAAARLVRKELAAIKGGPGKRGAAVKFAKDPAGWETWVRAFYDQHAMLVAESLMVDAGLAEGYAQGQALSLLGEGLGVVETWEEECSPRLVALALGEAPV